MYICIYTLKNDHIFRVLEEHLRLATMGGIPTSFGFVDNRHYLFPPSPASDSSSSLTFCSWKKRLVVISSPSCSLPWSLLQSTDIFIFVVSQFTTLDYFQYFKFVDVVHRKLVRASSSYAISPNEIYLFQARTNRKNRTISHPISKITWSEELFKMLFLVIKASYSQVFKFQQTPSWRQASKDIVDYHNDLHVIVEFGEHNILLTVDLQQMY